MQLSYRIQCTNSTFNLCTTPFLFVQINGLNNLCVQHETSKFKKSDEFFNTNFRSEEYFELLHPMHEIFYTTDPSVINTAQFLLMSLQNNQEKHAWSLKVQKT